MQNMHFFQLSRGKSDIFQIVSAIYWAAYLEDSHVLPTTAGRVTGAAEEVLLQADFLSSMFLWGKLAGDCKEIYLNASFQSVVASKHASKEGTLDKHSFQIK